MVIFATPEYTTIIDYISFAETMRIDILTLLPELLESPLNYSILKRAKEKGILEICLHNLRDYAHNKHKQADDYAFGGGAGMVMMVEPIDKCISILSAERHYDEIIYLTPDGERFTQRMANYLATLSNIMLLCGHYKGVDQRVRDHFITREVSIGDYVLSGGEIAASVLVDCTGRLIPGVLSDETSALMDSFQDDLLAPPVYTRPSVYKGWKVPDVLLSGHQQQIDDWRHRQSLDRTRRLRPDLLGENEQ
jgi:tRNA (guanine37-N1)-methyltransferase